MSLRYWVFGLGLLFFFRGLGVMLDLSWSLCCWLRMLGRLRRILRGFIYGFCLDWPLPPNNSFFFPARSTHHEYAHPADQPPI